MNDVHLGTNFALLEHAIRKFAIAAAGTTPERQLREVLPGGRVARSLAGSDDVTVGR